MEKEKVNTHREKDPTHHTQREITKHREIVKKEMGRGTQQPLSTEIARDAECMDIRGRDVRRREKGSREIVKSADFGDTQRLHVQFIFRKEKEKEV